MRADHAYSSDRESFLAITVTVALMRFAQIPVLKGMCRFYMSYPGDTSADADVCCIPCPATCDFPQCPISHAGDRILSRQSHPGGTGGGESGTDRYAGEGGVLTKRSEKYVGTGLTQAE